MLFRRVYFGALTLLLGLVVGACGSTATLQSGSVTESPTIDGALDEWGGGLTYVSDQPVSMSVHPTDSLLYVALSIQEQALVRSVLQNGLIVWVDPSKNQQQHYGIRYPIGLRKQQVEQGRSEGEVDAAASFSPEDVSFSELEIIEGETRRRIPAQFESGLRGKITANQGSFVYEIAIPVGPRGGAAADAAQHGVGASLGASFNIGLQTPTPEEDTELMPEQQNIPSVAGGTGRRGRRQRGRRQPQPPPPQQETGLPTLDLWVTVTSGAGSQ